MAHFKRKHPHIKVSSDWVYPQMEKGSSKRGRHSVAKFMAKANDSIKQWAGSSKVRISF